MAKKKDAAQVERADNTLEMLGLSREEFREEEAMKPCEELGGTVHVDIRLGSNREAMHAIGEELGLAGDALAMFKHACTEVKLRLSVDCQTGLARVIACDGRRLGERL